MAQLDQPEQRLPLHSFDLLVVEVRAGPIGVVVVWENNIQKRTFLLGCLKLVEVILLFLRHMDVPLPQHLHLSLEQVLRLACNFVE